jgi:hypothetical protein
MKILEIVKLVFTLIFITFNVFTYLFVKHIEDQANCKSNNCLNNEKIIKAYFLLDTVDFVKKFSMIAVGIGIINLLIPLTKTFINMFLIGSFLTLALLIVLVLQAVSLNKIINIIQSDACKADGCKLSKNYETFGNHIIGSTITIYAIIIASIIIGLKL